jgi:acyl-CoA synthetase (AMP-forming)/AMP-acid ligase II
MDADGYVTITSRLKEIINRGGEKISPREIDEVLLEHEAVRQAVAFAIPHASLGEEVGAAVVLKEDARATERELLAFVSGRLAAFKVPAVLRIVEELPRGATGKVQRLHMAKQLGLA